MGCSKFDDPVRDLGYEITEEAINSYAEVDGVKIKATITPVVPVEGNVTEFYVLVSRFPENFEFTSDKHIVEDVAKQSEDDSFEYNTLLQKAEFIGENNLAIPCFYLQEQVYFKSVPKHLMPAPKISCVYETFTRRRITLSPYVFEMGISFTLGTPNSRNMFSFSRRITFTRSRFTM